MSLPPPPVGQPGAPPPGAGTAARPVDAGAGAAWWGEAWTIFRAAPAEWIGIAIVYVIVTIVLMFVPVVGGIAQMVLTPVFAGGVMLGCDALARGQPLTVGHLFEGFRGRYFAPLLVLGLIWLGIVVAIAIVVVAGTFVVLGTAGVATLMRAANDASVDLSTIDYGTLLSAGLAFAALSAIAVIVTILAASAYWFAPALVVLNGKAPAAALRESFAASWINFGAFLLYGVIGLGLAIVASIPLLLGWIVLGPMTTASAYAGWRAIFGARR